MKVKDYCKIFACVIKYRNSYCKIRKEDLNKEVKFSYPALIDNETYKVLVTE